MPTRLPASVPAALSFDRTARRLTLVETCCPAVLLPPEELPPPRVRMRALVKRSALEFLMVQFVLAWVMAICCALVLL